MPKDQVLLDIPLVNESAVFWPNAFELWLLHKGLLWTDLGIFTLKECPNNFVDTPC